MPDVTIPAAAGAASLLTGAAITAAGDPISGIALIASGCNFLTTEAKARRLESNCETMRQLHEARETENAERAQANLDRAKEIRALAAKMSGPDWEEQAHKDQLHSAVQEERQKAMGRMDYLQKVLTQTREELQQRELELVEARQQVEANEHETAAVISSAQDKLEQANSLVQQSRRQSEQLSKRLQEMREHNRKCVMATAQAHAARRRAAEEAAVLRGKLDRQRRGMYFIGAVVCVGVAAYGAYRLYQQYKANQPAVGVPVSQERELTIGEIVEEVEQRERSEIEREEEEMRSELFIRFDLA